MGPKAYTYYRVRLSRVKNRLVQKLLYAFYICIRRDLKVYFISAPDAILLAGNPFTLHWLVAGCYKIDINDTITLPGNINSVHLNSGNSEKFIRIRFYGTRRAVEKQFYISPIDASLKIKPELSARSDQFKMQLLREELSHSLVKEFRYSHAFYPKLPAVAHIPNLTFTSAIKKITPLSVELEAYHPDNYKTLINES